MAFKSHLVLPSGNCKVVGIWWRGNSMSRCGDSPSLNTRSMLEPENIAANFKHQTFFKKNDIPSVIPNLFVILV